MGRMVPIVVSPAMILTIFQWVDHPTEGKVRQVGLAIKLSDTPGGVRSLSPVLGEHSEEILTGLGYNKERINELRHQGVIAW